MYINAVYLVLRTLHTKSAYTLNKGIRYVKILHAVARFSSGIPLKKARFPCIPLKKSWIMGLIPVLTV